MTGNPPPARFALFSFNDRFRTLHLTWFAFFLTFLVWFNFAPFSSTIADDLGLSGGQIKTIGLCNVALTVPARIFIGMALDKWGPRRVFSTLLMLAVIPNTVFATASSFETLVISRLALSIVGAGFVVGIRMVGEWFPNHEVGTAEGIYGGWGNFGSAAAAMSLPTIAGLFVEDGWRWSIFGTGIVACAYGLFYSRSVSDTPTGSTFARPAKVGAIAVSKPNEVLGLSLLTVPPGLALLVVAWRVFDMGIITSTLLTIIAVVVGALIALQLTAVRRINEPAIQDQVPQSEQYPFRSVAVLCVGYFSTFGSELTMVTMLPAFFSDTWGLSSTTAGLAAASFAFTNLVARPAGGILSDRLGSRKRTLTMLLAATTVGYCILVTVGGSWPVWAAIMACITCSVCVQATSGAVFAVVPLINKPSSGQIAGMVGAYGNVGAIAFLTFSILTGPRATFGLIAAIMAMAGAASIFLVEPTSSHGGHSPQLDLTSPAAQTTPNSSPLAKATR